MAKKPTFQQVKTSPFAVRPSVDVGPNPLADLGELGGGALRVARRGADYLRRSTPQKVSSDAVSMAKGLYDQIAADPVKFGLDTLAAGPQAMVDFVEARDQARRLRASGELDAARRLEEGAAAILLGAIPIAGKIGKAGKVAKVVKAVEKEVAPIAGSPFAITGKADIGQEVLRLKAKEMEVDPEKRTQPSGSNPLFDTSPEGYNTTEKILRQSDPAPVQAALPRAELNAKYPLNDRMRSVIDLTPKIAERLAEKAQQGRNTAQEYFYHTGPIVTGLEEIGVPRENAIDFLSNKFAPTFAGSSPRTATEQNLRNASILRYLDEKGVPLSEDIYDKYGNARGYNMMGSHYNLAGKMLEGRHDPMTNPKPSAFLPNTAGDLSHVTADTHNIRGMLLALNEVEPGGIHQSWFNSPEAKARYADTAQFDPSKDINDSLQSAVSGGRKVQVEYGPTADVTFEAARRSGIAPGAMQSLGWFGSGADTGLASATKTIPELINERVNVTAQALGIDPKAALKLFYEGKIPLMAKGGSVDANELSEKYNC